MEIKAALASLDTANDQHWTADGLPKLDVLSDMVGEKVSREAATEAWPGFTRNYGDDDGQEEEAEEVISEEELLNATLGDLAQGGLTLIEAWMVAADKQQRKARQEYNDAKKRLDEFSRFADAVERMRIQFKRRQPKQGGDTAIQDYLKKQREARKRKQANAAAFIAAGTSAQDVAAGLNVKAPIDQALNQRRAKPGSTRPAHDLPVRK